MNIKFQHETDDNGNQIVTVSGLRVVVTQDATGLFCAQGLEIDYAAAGDTVEAVRDNFMNGFCQTLLQHILVFGHCDALLVRGPEEAWNMFYTMRDVQVTRQPFEPKIEFPDLLPGFLKSINFLEQPTTA